MKNKSHGYQPIMRMIALLMQDDKTSLEIQEELGVCSTYVSNTLKTLELYGMAHICRVHGQFGVRTWRYGEGESVKERKNRAQSAPKPTHSLREFMRVVEAVKHTVTSEELAIIMGITRRNAQQILAMLRKHGLTRIQTYAGKEPRHIWGQGRDASRKPPLSASEKARRYRASKLARESRAVERLSFLAANDPFGLIAA
jgi:predicted transcriptional regulator